MPNINLNFNKVNPKFMKKLIHWLFLRNKSQNAKPKLKFERILLTRKNVLVWASPRTFLAVQIYSPVSAKVVLGMARTVKVLSNVKVTR